MAMMATATAFAEQPRVDQNEVTMVQDPGSGNVTVTYKVTGADGIVTVDFQTNYVDEASNVKWVSIGSKHFNNVVGAVNKLVAKDVTESICWRPRRTWPSQRCTEGNVRAVVTVWPKDDPPDYMVCDLVVKNDVRFYVDADALPDGGVEADIYKTDRIVFRRIPAVGVIWRRGSPSTQVGVKYYDSDHGWNNDYSKAETPKNVTLTQDFYIGVYELTRGQYRNLGVKDSSGNAVTAENPTLPIDKLKYGTIHASSTWPEGGRDPSADDAFRTAFLNQTGVQVDLPTGTQWEYACRAGTGTGLNDGTELASWRGSDDDIGRLGWYKGNGESVLHPVGRKIPNGWGLYDMHGNACEWVLDNYREQPTDEVTDPKGPTSEEMAGLDRLREFRGGREAGVRVVAVRCGYAAEGELEEAGADVIVDTLEDLRKTLFS